jgi:hypothetical protein
MKKLMALSILFMLIFSAFIGLALFGSDKTFVEAEVTVQAPVSVVLKALQEQSPQSAWARQIRVTKLLKNGNRRTLYHFGSRQLPVNEVITFQPQKNIVLTVQTDERPASLLGNIRNTVVARSLPDGSTAINWKLEYTLFSLSSRLLNSFFIRPDIQHTLTRHLRDFAAFLGN